MVPGLPWAWRCTAGTLTLQPSSADLPADDPAALIHPIDAAASQPGASVSTIPQGRGDELSRRDRGEPQTWRQIYALEAAINSCRMTHLLILTLLIRSSMS